VTSPFLHDGIGFNYEVFGKGAAVVFCHGLGGDLNQPRDLVGRLDGCRLVVWDARGHGLTEPLGPARGFNFATFASDLHALLDHLDIQRAVIGGISMGAGIAARFATDWPERVRALVLMRPAWGNKPIPDNLRLFPVVAEYLGRFGGEKGLGEFLKLPGPQSLRKQSACTFDSLCQQFSKHKAIERHIRLKAMPNDCPVTDWSPVERCIAPALVVGNDPDPAHPLRLARLWAQHLPNARLVQVPTKSHGSDEHALAFRKHLISFLEALEK
jgi:pimeloyl-ACP methyl ester carboxylesterase